MIINHLSTLIAFQLTGDDMQGVDYDRWSNQIEKIANQSAQSYR